MEFWHNLFSSQGFMARRACGLWDESLVQLHVFSDVAIWLAYLWIPLVMVWNYHAHKRALRLHFPTLLILILYTVFITACGWTHFFDALMFYNPVYRANGLVRAITAAASVGTAISLVRLMPLAIKAPVTILTQRATLRQQHEWLRDILDSVTDGRLKLCGDRSKLPDPLGPEPKTIHIGEPNGLRPLRKMIRDAAASAGFGTSQGHDLLSCVHEAAMNALVHAGAATVRCYSAENKLQVWIEDTGPGISLDKLPVATLKQGFSTAGTAGQGWHMILSLVDAAYLLTGSDGTTLVLEMDRVARRPVPFSVAVGGDVLAN